MTAPQSTVRSRLIVFAAFVVLDLSLLPEGTSAGVLVLRDTKWKSDGAKRIEIGPAQRCYSFTFYSNKASLLKWSNMQTHSWLTFFKDEDCKGDYMKAEPSEAKVWPSDDFDNDISSFMLWESSIYPTRRIINVCAEEEAFMVTNHSLPIGLTSSNSSSSSGGSDDGGRTNATVVGDIDG